MKQLKTRRLRRVDNRYHGGKYQLVNVRQEDPDLDAETTFGSNIRYVRNEAIRRDLNIPSLSLSITSHHPTSKMSTRILTHKFPTCYNTTIPSNGPTRERRRLKISIKFYREPPNLTRPQSLCSTRELIV